MSFVAQTPQRQLPGAFLATPAPNRGHTPPSQQPSALRNVSYPSLPKDFGRVSQPAPAQPMASPAPAAPENLKPLQRAAGTINETLEQEKRYPELDSYVGQGISSEYRIPQLPATAPFQKTKTYDIPEKILEQHNRAQISTLMGLFAELNHAWIAIDNALYLWDYTHPNPDLIGFEEQPNSITAVKLVVPRAGVFTPQITHLLVLATAAEMILVGLSCGSDPAGNKTVNLYQTRMVLAVRGLAVSVIEGSAATGRIFFSNSADNDVYELTYQQEEKWFQGRCRKVNHTARGIATLAPTWTPTLPALPFGHRSGEYIVQIVTDDTRQLLYTLSSTSAIRIFHMKPNGRLDCCITQPWGATLGHIGHVVTGETELLGPDVSIVSLSPISATEAQKLHLMATTSTGCRMFISATSSMVLWGSASSPNPPTSIRVQHIKFPPPLQGNRPTQQQQTPTDTNSKALNHTRMARRYPPGYFFCFFTEDPRRPIDRLFLAAPHAGRISRPRDSSQPASTSQFAETGLWMLLESHVEDVGLVSAPFVAAATPLGFGNELAIQYDKPPAEVAILTNTGIHTIRRRRLVDIFAAAIQQAWRLDALEAEVRKFINVYGRGEVTATALAVACGQGEDVGPDARITKITNPEILESARKIFIEFGGKPVVNENLVVDQSGPTINNARPSPRHEGIALYISRLVRSIWKAPILLESTTPLGGLVVTPTVSLQKLRDIQRDLSRLQEFFAANKSFIDGLAGPESLTQVKTKQEEIALQAEHRALHSLVVLISNIIEGIAFILVFFEDNKVEDILLSLSEVSRHSIRKVTFEGLFTTEEGKELAKELVKAIVNRNIANGSNVDTVAEALRRRCGSFCSADDVVIFKAQELLNKASEAGGNSDSGRRMLNESLRLFQQVAASLSMEQLQWAAEQFTSMEFYAGAIQLALTVAKEKDRGNRALAWINDGRKDEDPRKDAYNQRTSIYKLIRDIIRKVDHASSQALQMVDGIYTTTAKRHEEAYSVIDNSDDEVFQYVLYDWYLENGWTDRLLSVRSSYVVSYLQRKSKLSVDHADLLWRYYAQRERYHDAAVVQFTLAKSDFQLSLEKRIEYLSKAKANVLALNPGIGRNSRLMLTHEISDLLDVGNIQDDLLQRISKDPRVVNGRREDALNELNGRVLSLSELFNVYADAGSYFDISLLIYKAADHRKLVDIQATWSHLIEQTHNDAIEKQQAQPYEVVSETVRRLGRRLQLAENTFPIPTLLPLLERYAFNYLRHTPSERAHAPAKEWVIETFLDLGVPYDTLLPVLEAMFYNDEAASSLGPSRRWIAEDILYLCQRWYADTLRAGVGAGVVASLMAGGGGGSLGGSGGRPGGGGGGGAGGEAGRTIAREEHVSAISNVLMVVVQNAGLSEELVDECRTLRLRVEQLLR
ncbi:MAG: hypothetical protein M1816_000135 [Peltula sp. TS41687]|nr:MAG: hypothetical protein M1816_000135 [Peltula sp. TS41687]